MDSFDQSTLDDDLELLLGNHEFAELRDTLSGDHDSLFGDYDGLPSEDDKGLASPHEATTPTTTRPEGPAVAPAAHAPAQPAFPGPAASWTVPTVPSAFSSSPRPFVSAAPAGAYGPVTTATPAAPSVPSRALSFVASPVATPDAPSVVTPQAPSFVAAPAGAYGPVTAATPAAPSVPSRALSFVASPVATPDAPSVLTPRGPSFVAAPAGAYDSTPATAAPASSDEEETHPAQAADSDSDNDNDAGVTRVGQIHVGQIPGFQYGGAATRQGIWILSTIDAIEAKGEDIGDYLAPFLTMSSGVKLGRDISPALEIDEGTRKKVLTPAIKQWLAASGTHSRLLDTIPANMDRLDTKVSLIAASVGILRSNDCGTTWFGGETRKLVWPRDSTVLCFHFARLLYLTLRSHRQGARNRSPKSPEVLPAAPGPAPAQAAAPAAGQAAPSAPARAQVAASASAQVTAPDELGGALNPIDLDAVSPPAAHVSPEDITPPPRPKRKRPDWLKNSSLDHHVNGGFGAKRARQV